tara:strand:+ start:1284 stop:1502 length:219 start_codon:yes stop_codon:yes gene_type:complete
VINKNTKQIHKGEYMSNPVMIDMNERDQDFERTLEKRVEALERQVTMLLETQESILQNFREMILAVTEISTE